MVHYIIVRADLPHGVQVAQTAHAAGESVQAPLPDETIVVALAVPDEAQLLELRRNLALAQLGHRLVMETGGPYAGQAMAIGVHPTTDRAAVRKVVSHLGLVR